MASPRKVRGENSDHKLRLRAILGTNYKVKGQLIANVRESGVKAILPVNVSKQKCKRIYLWLTGR